MPGPRDTVFRLYAGPSAEVDGIVREREFRRGVRDGTVAYGEHVPVAIVVRDDAGERRIPLQTGGVPPIVYLAPVAIWAAARFAARRRR